MTADAPGIFRGKRLVIFGAGYVGGTVARQAIARGLHVTALTRNSATAALLKADGVETVVTELASSAWHARIAGAEFVLNCVSSGGGGLAGYRKSYDEGMQSILTWAAASGGVGTMIYTSSTSVYPQSGGVVVDETAPTAGAGDTAQVLIEAENRLRAATEACRRWFILRLAGIYGPGRHHLLDQLRAGATEMAGRGDARLNLIHRDDIAAAIWAAFAAPQSVANEVFNLADDAPATKAEVVAWIAEQVGAAVPRFTGAPAGGRRAVTPDRTISNARAKAVLGWRPHYGDFRAGYRAILEA